MSEADNVWRVDVGGREREIELDHSTMTGKIVVKIDGEEVADDRMLARKKEIEIDVDGHKAVIDTSFKYGGMGVASALHLDGEYVEPLRK